MVKENVVYIHNGVLFSHNNKNMSFTGKWIELENIIFSEISETQKVKDHFISRVEAREEKEKERWGDLTKIEGILV